MPKSPKFQQKIVLYGHIMEVITAKSIELMKHGVFMLHSSFHRPKMRAMVNLASKVQKFHKKTSCKGALWK